MDIDGEIVTFYIYGRTEPTRYDLSKKLPVIGGGASDKTYIDELKSLKVHTLRSIAELHGIDHKGIKKGQLIKEIIKAKKITG